MRQDAVIVDPALSKVWFDRGTAPLVERPGAYASAGIRVISCSFPDLVVGLRWREQGREMRLRVRADNYDHLPPSGWWIDAGGAPLRAAGQVPAGGGFQPPPNPYGEGKGWLCFPGWREYHDHHSHLGHTWQSIRGVERYRLPGTIVQLLRALNGGCVELR